LLKAKNKEPGAKKGGIFANISRRRRVDKAITAAKGDPNKPQSVKRQSPTLPFTRTAFAG